MDTLIARLENVVGQLSGGGGGEDAEGVPVALSEYNVYYDTHVQPFIDACNKFDDTKKIGAWCEKAWKNLGTLIEAACQCKKPSPEATMGQLAQMIEVFNEAGNPDSRAKTFPQEKSFAEAIAGLNWVMADLPRPVVQGGLEAADFYLNKALTAAKDLEDPEKTDRRAFVRTLKTMMTELATYVVAFHKTGLAWKIRGADISEFKSGQKAASSEGKDNSPEGRLDACIAILEAVAAKANADDGDGPPASLVAWNEFFKESVQPFIDTCGTLEETKKIKDWTQKAFDHMTVLMTAAPSCAKPGQEDFMKFLGPIVEVITASGNPDSRAPSFNFEKSFAEGIQSLSWVMMDLPRPFVAGQLEAADFYLTKCLTLAKDKDDATKKNMRDYVKNFKQLLNKMADYTKEFHKTGLAWKMKDGTKLLDWKA